MCPFKNCKKKFHKVQSLTCHLSRYHRCVKIIDDAITLDNQTSISNQSDESGPCESFSFLDPPDQAQCNIENNNIDNSTNIFLESLASFFLKLEHQLSIPSSTVQLIVSQILSVHELGERKTKITILPHLLDSCLAVDDAKNVLDEILECNPFNVMNRFKRSYLRQNYYKKKFSYVEPVQIQLNNEMNGKQFFHYVPIAETLRKNLNNKNFYDKLSFSNEKSGNGVLSDFTDGSVFQKKNFFGDNPKGLKPILYQDSFEVVNLIGLAKKKYKILAVYLNIGNLPDFLRSRVNYIQLVALCIEKNLIMKKFMEKLSKI